MEDPMEHPKLVYELYIGAPVDWVWKAIIDPELTERYFFDSKIHSTWEVGTNVRLVEASGIIAVEGTVLEYEPPYRLSTTFRYLGDEQTQKDAPSRVTWELTPAGDVTVLSMIHDEFEGATATLDFVSDGWPFILSNLKTWIETGTTLKPTWE
jgi:uncharacterized protein YndB with AHSA1/START domain